MIRLKFNICTSLQVEKLKHILEKKRFALFEYKGYHEAKTPNLFVIFNDNELKIRSSQMVFIDS